MERDNAQAKCNMQVGCLDVEMMSVERDNITKPFSLPLKREPSSNKITFDHRSINVVSKVPSKYICILCQEVMLNPIQTVRGEVACRKCYVDKKMKNGKQDICPIDGEPIQSKDIFIDRSISREINKLLCSCSYEKYGCSWTGALGDINTHEHKCEYHSVECKECKEMVGNQQLEDHLKVACVKREVTCSHCGNPYRHEEIKRHDIGCSEKKLECPFHCSKQIMICDLWEHSKSCSQLLSMKICPFQKFGCSHKVNGEASLKKHLEDASLIHAIQAIAMTLAAERYKDISQYRIQELEDTMNELQSKIDNLLQQLEEMQKQKDDLKYLGKIEHRIQKIEKSDYKNNEKIKLLELMQSELHNIAMDSKLSPLLKQHNDLVQCASEIEKNRTTIDQIEMNFAIMNSSLSDTDLKLRLLENTSYSGRQVWKVDNLRYRLEQSRKGSVTALHSAPAFTNQFGYKFCTRLYLNGDGVGKNTHISIFFVVMRSPYDDLLAWPFVKRVTFRILNHEEKSRTRKETFLTDKNSSSFQQPKKEMNIAAGCPTFMNINTLLDRGYVVDDSIFVETVVEDPT